LTIAGYQTMHSPLRITFRHLAHSAALEQEARQLADRLTRFYDRISDCRVVIETTNGRPGRQGYTVKVELIVPGGTINVSNAEADASKHRDPYVALRTAFEAARRQLTDFAEALP
jgi:ribosome-associated translation inhibitor RaiA